MKFFNLKNAVVLTVLVAVFAFHSSVIYAKEIPAETLAKISTFTDVKMSPDGNYIASMRPVKGKKYLIIESIDPAIKKQTAVFNPAKATVSRYMWLNDDRLAVSVYYNRVFRGVTYREWRLLAIGKDGKKVINLVKEENGRGAQAGLFNIVSILPDEENYILVESYGTITKLTSKTGTSNVSGVYKVNIKTGKRKIVTSHKNIDSWYADHEGNVRLAFGGVGTKIKVVMRGKGGGGWKTLDRYDRITGNAKYDVAGFSPEENIIYVGSELNNEPYAFYKYDLINKQYGEKLFGKENIQEIGRAHV